ncbi:hypothetical protein CEP54_005439 [Fusarium duplospermum]|uniref:Uncharacterized protein n=1 Tax=Fusarium duplospermum TaxID=1325734 RepID=A0A428QCP0_9HYPO|nr:hypothetical protein CEP54_005439 [Fusarium duplospermum]
MRVTETTPLLAQPSSPRPGHSQVNSPGEPSDILCPHPSSHRLHIKLTLAQRAKKDRQTHPSYERLSVIQEEDEETVSHSEEADDSISGLSSLNGGTDNSDEESYGSIQGSSSSNGGADNSGEELITPDEQAVLLQPVMVPIVVQPRHAQTLEEGDTWEVGCVSSMCWPLMCLFRKLDTAPDEQDGPRPAPLSEVEDSDAEFADDEYSSSTESSGSSSVLGNFTPHLAPLMPAAIVEFRRLLFSDERVLEFRRLELVYETL